MRAVRFDSFGSRPYVCEVPDPIAQVGGVVIDVRATGICRSDWHGWQGHDPDIRSLPHVPGHELAGVVSEVGAGVAGCAVGDRVTVPFVCACGTCPTCRAGLGQVCPDQWQPGFSGPGSFAERVAIPRADPNIVHLPDAVSDATAATLGCRFATAYRAVRQVAAVQPGEMVAVIGCGGVGLSAVMIAIAEGAIVVAVDTRSVALDHARALGAHHVVDAGRDDVVEALRDLAPRGIDVGIDAIGDAGAAAASIHALRPRGRHVQVGLLPTTATAVGPGLPMAVVIARELQVLGSHGMAAAGYAGMLERIADGRLRPVDLVTTSISLDEVPESLMSMAAPQGTGITVCVP